MCLIESTLRLLLRIWFFAASRTPTHVLYETSSPSTPASHALRRTASCRPQAQRKRVCDKLAPKYRDRNGSVGSRIAIIYISIIFALDTIIQCLLHLRRGYPPDVRRSPLKQRENGRETYPANIPPPKIPADHLKQGLIKDPSGQGRTPENQYGNV